MFAMRHMDRVILEKDYKLQEASRTVIHTTADFYRLLKRDLAHE